MKKEEVRKVSFYVGLFLFIIPLYLAIFKGTHHWYYPAVIGAWLVFDYISSKKNKTSFTLLLNKDFKRFFTLYLTLSIVGILIELVGQYWWNWWYYPYLNKYMLLVLIPLFYPFILMMFRDMYKSMIMVFTNRFVSFISAMILSILIWEWPALKTGDWIYQVPFGKEIFQLNVIIIFFWIPLIGIPVMIYKKILGE
jgi:hypothetical protein